MGVRIMIHEPVVVEKMRRSWDTAATTVVPEVANAGALIPLG
jgi:hypothetical protein